jgi:hypothetical protein
MAFSFRYRIREDSSRREGRYSTLSSAFPRLAWLCTRVMKGASRRVCTKAVVRLSTLRGWSR